MSSLKVGIVGATGAVGLEILKLLEKRKFPVSQIFFFASNRSSDKKLTFQGVCIPIQTLSAHSFDHLDVVFFAAGGSISKEYAPIAQKKGCLVIDNSSFFRQKADVPLVIPEVNPKALKNHQGLIANPNCATILMLMALAPLHMASKIKRVVVSTYQAASGAGLKAMKELKEETLAHLENRTYERSCIPYPYAFNLFLHNSPLKENGYVEEELKMLYETRKILDDESIRVAATCVRVPVLRSHSASINAEFHEPLSAKQAQNILMTAQGVKLFTNPTPLDATGQDEVFCGRIRDDASQKNTLDLWVVTDQLLKGASLNAVQIAELVISGA